MKKHCLHIILLLLLSLTQVAAADMQVISSVDKQEILIGEQVTFRVDVSSEADNNLVWPLLGDTLNQFEIVERSEVDSSFVDGLYKRSQTFKVTCFDSGQFAIPRLHFRYQEGNSGRVKSSDAILIKVGYPEVNMQADIKPIKDIMKVELSWMDYWRWIAGGLLALSLLAFGIWYLFFRKKPEEVEEVFVPVLPPHEHALQRLDNLEAAKLWQSGKVKDYYSELTDILREYMERRFDIPAMESTSDEIVAAMKPINVKGTVKERLVSLLQMADLAKFAKMVPSVENNVQSMKDVRKFVTHTRQKVVQTQEEEQTA